MQNKKSNAGRFAGMGYYIALTLCAVAIGVTGYLYYRNANPEAPSLEDPSGVVDVMNPSGSVSDRPTAATLPTDTTAPLPMPLQTCRPVNGQVVMDYAMDCLCYNPTTRDWRTHSGVDYAADAGTAVMAAADGTVYTVYQDDTMGYTVVIQHADGFVTTYASLSQDVQVAAGDTVTMGQTIGFVGVSALMETALGDHVHFAVTCDGKTVDPEAFFELS